MESDALTRGYDVVVANTDYQPSRLVSSIRLMIGRRVAGLALVVSEMDPGLINELAESQIPVVFYDVGVAKGNITNIRVNYQKGIENIVAHLHGLGHRRMAFVGHHAALGPISDRQKTFMDAVGRCDGHVDVRAVAHSDGLEGGRLAARELLSGDFLPTAIVCVNDFMAVGVMGELRDRGLQIPRDVSITGFDNIKLSEFSYPPLTTVHIPREQIGHTAFECLVPDQLADVPPPGRDVLIDPEFIVRQSTGPASK